MVIKEDTENTNSINPENLSTKSISIIPKKNIINPNTNFATPINSFMSLPPFKIKYYLLYNVLVRGNKNLLKMDRLYRMGLIVI